MQALVAAGGFCSSRSAWYFGLLMYKPLPTISSRFPIVFLVAFAFLTEGSLMARTAAPAQATPSADQAAPAAPAQVDSSKAASESKPAEQAEPAPVEAKPIPAKGKAGAEPAKAEVREPRLPSLHEAVTGNAVTVLHTRGSTLMFSLMGMGAKKSWDAVTNEGFYLDPDWDKWYPLKSVPGTAGRIDAAAIGLRGSVFLFGGMVVDEQNRGMVLPDVNIYAASSETWRRGTDLPVAVADAVVGAYHDRYIYVIGGRSNDGVVAKVQIYDTEKSRWSAGTPLPGNAVFGHAGGLVDDTIVIVDGAYKNPSAGPAYLPSDQCWMGKIDRKDPGRIEWSKMASHPGTARFGIAAGASERDRKIYFSGGTDNPDGDTGIGFDGKPAEPSAMTFAWNLRAGKWEVVNEATPNPTMNNDGMIVLPDGIAIAGGLEKHQTVTRRVTLLPFAMKAH